MNKKALQQKPYGSGLVCGLSVTKEKCRVHVEDILPILYSERIEANRKITLSFCDVISTPPS